MLQRTGTTTSRYGSLVDISPDGKKGYLIPGTTHHPIAVSLYDDGVLRIGTTQIDTKKIMPDLRSCAITATAWENTMVGVSINLRGKNEDAAGIYFEYDYDKPRQHPLYLVRGRGHAPVYTLKSFSRMGWGQRIAKLLPGAYPCVTV